MLNLNALSSKIILNYKNVAVAVLGIALGASIWAIPPAQAQNEAEKTYKAKCVSCHAADGSGSAVGKKLGVNDFRSPEVQKMTDEELIEITAKGKAKMPGYAKSLKPEEIKQLVDYIRELVKGAAGGSAMLRDEALIARGSR